MPAIIAHTITIWCPSFYRPELGNDGFLHFTEGMPQPGERLIDHLREQWMNVERPNHDPGFNPSPVQSHVNGWASFTATYIAHEGDDEVVGNLLKQARTGWIYCEGSTPVRVQHHEQDLG